MARRTISDCNSRSDNVGQLRLTHQERSDAGRLSDRVLRFARTERATHQCQRCNDEIEYVEVVVEILRRPPCRYVEQDLQAEEHAAYSAHHIDSRAMSIALDGRRRGGECVGQKPASGKCVVNQKIEARTGLLRWIPRQGRRTMSAEAVHRAIMFNKTNIMTPGV